MSDNPIIILCEFCGGSNWTYFTYLGEGRYECVTCHEVRPVETWTTKDVVASSDPAPTCTTCQHIRPNPIFPAIYEAAECRKAAKIDQTWNPIVGFIRVETSNCSDMRDPYGPCGPNGLLWEKKQPPKTWREKWRNFWYGYY